MGDDGPGRWPRAPIGGIANVLGKLGLRDRVQAVIYAYETGLFRT